MRSVGIYGSATGRFSRMVYCDDGDAALQAGAGEDWIYVDDTQYTITPSNIDDYYTELTGPSVQPRPSMGVTVAVFTLSNIPVGARVIVEDEGLIELVNVEVNDGSAELSFPKAGLYTAYVRLWPYLDHVELFDVD